MKIGIDISQIAYEGTGVANYVKNLVENLLEYHDTHEYILFYASLRKELPASKYWSRGGTLHNNFLSSGKVTIAQYKLPPTVLDILWNRLHIVPIEKFIGNIDVFISSDWTQPPSKAKKATILYDLIVYKYPEETHNQTKFNFKQLILSPNIVASQKRRLYWVKKEVDAIICISKATKQDALDILGVSENRLHVVYPGF
jgi:hypothetical protein